VVTIIKNNIGKVIIIIILVVLVVGGILFYQDRQNASSKKELNDATDISNEVEKNNETILNVVNSEITNEIDTEQSTDEDEVPGDMGEYYISIGKWKEFKFNTPVGENGKFKIYAEKAVQASGFSGASAHIYYLREGELYYHNQEEKDVKLASGITDLKKQGEDIIAVKGENAKIYEENQYIQYK